MDYSVPLDWEREWRSKNSDVFMLSSLINQHDVRKEIIGQFSFSIFTLYYNSVRKMVRVFE
jgi:hypothetical protein